MNALWRDKAAATSAAEKLKSFAQPQRLMIISALLAHGELTVSAIDEATGIGQPALSQQLAELRKANVVETRREAKLIHYRLVDDLTRLCAHHIEALFGKPTAQTELSAPHELAEQTVEPSGAASFARILTSR